MSSVISLAVSVFLWLGVVFLYFAPATIAEKRGLKNQCTIYWFTLLTGWTIIGWVVALIWAFTDNDKF